MTTICNLFSLLTNHPGSFLDYSAWIALRELRSSETGPCPFNQHPITDGLWLARYIYDSVAPYVPESYVEHDIKLSNLENLDLESDLNKLAYLTNRHLVLEDSTNRKFSAFDESLVNEWNTSELQQVRFNAIKEFHSSLKQDASDKTNAFLLLCLAFHTAYNNTAKSLKDQSLEAVTWNDSVEERLVAVHKKVFPIELEEEINFGENDSSSHKPNNHNLDEDYEDEDDYDEDSPLIGNNSNDPPTMKNSSGDNIFQRTILDREPFERTPQPKKNSKAELDWVALGFQGTNPATDFRATGHLGLWFFEQFCLADPMLARDIMAESGSFNGDIKKPWYSVALISIHFTLFIQRAMGGRYLYRGIISNIKLQDILKHLSENSSHEEAVKAVETIQERMLISLSKLHNEMMKSFHEYWKDGVRNGSIKSILDADACLLGFEEKIQYKLFDGEWDL